ncbi:MAG: hypothetical protein KC643_22325 [Nitrospira sp.]|nr:hypothetical protein [Nitrospira sp.]
MTQQKINIDFSQIQKGADKTVQRAAAFMGLGLNAAYDENFKSYQLAPITQIEVLPSNLNDDSISHLKSEFALWIIAGGLNELIEGFESLLERIHLIPLLIKLRNGSLTHPEARKERKNFTYSGLKDKLTLLREKHKLIFENSPYLESLAFARNCFTHRHGIVGQADLKNDSSDLTIEWKGMDVFVSTPQGEEISIIPSGGKKSIFLKEGGTIKLRPNVVRSRKFSKGQQIYLSPHDLSEICLFIMTTSKEFIQAVQAYVKEQGMPEVGQDAEG